MNDFSDQVVGKKVLVFGLGRQGGGEGDLLWLKKHGATVKISDSDLTLCPGGQTKDQIDWAEIIIKNPAVPDDHQLLLYASSLGKAIFTSIALFVKYAPLTVIAVTGTRGKSTTVALIAAILEAAYPGQILVGGNIPGTSGLSLLDQTAGKKYAVLELSSFQLHSFHALHLSPKIALITNLYPDHLNRYPSMELYRQDKEAICQYQESTDICIFNADNPGALALSQRSVGQKIAYSAKDYLDWPTTLKGPHNRENIAAAATLATTLNIAPELTRQVVGDFITLPFRQEKIATIDGVTYINDTTATTPTACLKALQTCSTPTIWITGGDTKNLPFEVLLEEVKDNPHLKNIVILGSKNIPSYTKALTQLAGDKILGTAHTMSDAVKLARGSAKPGDTILLSPGFASFDLFQNEFDRGRQFNDCVKNLKPQPTAH